MPPRRISSPHYQGEREALLTHLSCVTIRPDHNESQLSEALALKPSLGATRAIGSRDVFGDHAFKVSVDTCLKEGSTLSCELLAELNTTVGIGTKKMLQH